ncbi:unnamed protein product [Paramecium primaurelia]|uniref:Uncharacterized protein n=1 Tax=Paramecium primaurelia TaxID=5886 RepID=A0A8S1PH78_PARPR|nr:unnamed protein product [Paramecium primaurelia]
MFEQKFKDLRIKMKTKKVKKISLSLKQLLIESVMTDHLSIHQASKLHSINYSSAKYIINLYKKLGTVTPQQSKQRRKPKVYIIKTSVLVDYNSGEILLYKQNQLKKQNHQENQQICMKKGLIMTSKSIFQSLKIKEKIISESNSDYKKFPTFTNISELKNYIQIQHKLMIS